MSKFSLVICLLKKKSQDLIIMSMYLPKPRVTDKKCVNNKIRNKNVTRILPGN